MRIGLKKKQKLIYFLKKTTKRNDKENEKDIHWMSE